MTKRSTFHRWALLASLAGLAALPLGAAQGKQEPEAPKEARGNEKLKEAPFRTRSNQYEIRYLDLHSAEEMAWDLCSHRDSCEIRTQKDMNRSLGYLVVEADNLTHERIARRLAELDIAPTTQSFQLILLAGSTQAGTTPKDLSPGAQKALNDLKGFLPYKSYALLDSTFLRGTPEAPSTARLVGRGGAAYNLRMAFDAAGLEEKRQLFVSRFALREEGGTTPVVPSRTDATGGSERRAPRDLVDTTFSLKPGETIVVGTSRLDGSEDALVVLLTAAK